MPATLDALQHLERTVFSDIDLVGTHELISDAEALSNDLQSNSRTARSGLPSAEEEQLCLV